MSDQEPKVADGAGAAAAETNVAEKPQIKSDTDAAVADSAKSENNPSEAPEGALKEGKEEATSKEEDAKKTQNAAPSVRNPPKNMLQVLRPRDAEAEKRNNKFDPSVLEDSSDPDAIRTQVQFYFSDSNLYTDKFLSELTGGSENKPVPLSTLLSFKRMRRFKPRSAVVTALKDSKFLVVEGDDGQETIRRKKPFDPEKLSKVDEQSVYVKGFGEEAPSTQFDIEAFFSQFGEFNQVRLRRADNGGFKGSAFVEWVDKATAEKFMALDPKPQWKEHDLLILWKLDYMAEKTQLIREGKIDANRSNRNGGFHRGGHRGGKFGRGRDRGQRGGRRDFDRDDWKKRREEDQKNGFSDRRGGYRGRGRGSFRGRGRDGADETREKKEAPVSDPHAPPKIHVAKQEPSADKEGENANGKRARNEDTREEPPAKKVDTKGVPVEAA